MSSPLMRPDEFEHALLQLPADLRERAHRIRSCVLRDDGCPYCRIAGRSLDLAFRAALYDQHDWARVLVAEAESYADADRHAGACARRRPSFAPATQVWRGVHRQVTRWADTAPVIAATDASWKKDVGGLGYITTTGRWGYRGRSADRNDPTGPARVLVSELRAVELLLSELGDVPDLLLLVDSRRALTFLRTWQCGRTDAMPEGYDLRPRRSGAPTLVRLAERVAALPGLRMEHVKGHSGHPLNEAADSLAKIARRRMTEPFDAVGRAADLAASFLLTWHQQAAVAA